MKEIKWEVNGDDGSVQNPPTMHPVTIHGATTMGQSSTLLACIQFLKRKKIQGSKICW
jgi:hypothetical protein